MSASIPVRRVGRFVVSLKGALRMLVASAVLVAPAGFAADPAPVGAGSPPADTIDVPSRSSRRSAAQGAPSLDSLLQLPQDYVAPGPRPVAGAGEAEWRRRFEKASREVNGAREALARTKEELDGVAAGGSASQWSVAPPNASGAGGGGGGLDGSNSPLSFRLREELKRNRDRVETSVRALRELKIEADLAGVPVSWRGEIASVQGLHTIEVDAAR